MLRSQQFTLASITEKKMKVYYVLSQLDHRYVREVQDIVISPPQQGPCMKPKTELLNRLSPSREKCTRQLLTSKEMDDHKPSQFLRYLRSPNSDVLDRLLHIICTSRLPSNVQVTLADIPEIELDAVVLCTDRIIEAISPASLVSITPNSTVAGQFPCKAPTHLIPIWFQYSQNPVLKWPQSMFLR
jgi:hypothetical protein